MVIFVNLPNVQLVFGRVFAEHITMLQPETLPSAFIQTFFSLHLYFSYPVEFLFLSHQFLFNVGNHHSKQSQWLSYEFMGTSQLQPLLWTPCTQSLLDCISAFLRLTQCFPLNTYCLLWLSGPSDGLFLPPLYFHTCQILTCLKVCPCLFGL